MGVRRCSHRISTKTRPSRFRPFTQTSENGTTNAQVLKVANPSQLSGGVEGLTVVGGHVTAIEWKDKHLAGQLSLNNFKSLTKVDVSRNKLTSVAVVNAPAPPSSMRAAMC